MKLCAGVVETEKKDQFINSVSFVLHNQLVTARAEGEAWRVRSGSGMCLLCSPDVSNVAFDRLVGAYATHTEVKNMFNITAYWRYMDDGLIIAGGSPEERRNYLNEIKRKGAFFEMKFEQVNEQFTNYLDLYIWKGKRSEESGKWDVRVCRKVMSLAEPLRPLSHCP